jgi:hypothetical protein
MKAEVCLKNFPSGRDTKTREVLVACKCGVATASRINQLNSDPLGWVLPPTPQYNFGCATLSDV